MTSKEALKVFYEDTKNYNNDMRKYPAFYFDKPKNEEMLREWSVKQNEMYATILGDLELLEKYKQIEKELGVDLITLFSQKFKRSDDLEVEEEKTIYFCGDSYYGHWTKEEWLDFIKEVISAYRELVKLGR